MKNKNLVIILTISVLTRVAAAIYFGNTVVDLPGTYDQISYHNLALRVLNGNGFSFNETWWPITPPGAPTAHWSFLYTFYLVGTYLVFGPNPIVARIIQAILTGIFHPLFVYILGKEVFTKTIGIFAAGLTAIYAYFIYYDATLMTEPFFICFVLVSLVLIISVARKIKESGKSGLLSIYLYSILLGLSLGGAILLRQLFLIFVPFFFIWIVWVNRNVNIRIAFFGILISGLIVVLLIIPFSIYNLNRFGHFVLLNTNSGYAFFWANHPIYGTNFQPILTNANYQDLIPVDLRNLDEALLDQALLRRGLQFILDDPIRYFQLSLSRIPIYFMFWPSKDSGIISNISRVASFGILWPFMLAGLIRCILNQTGKIFERISSPSFLLISFAFIYSIIHILTWALIRYRLPVDAVLLIFAGYIIIDIVNKYKIKNFVGAIFHNSSRIHQARGRVKNGN